MTRGLRNTHQTAKLGLLTTCRRAAQASLHGRIRQGRVVVRRGDAAGTRWKRVKARKRALAHQQVSWQVVAAQGQGSQHVVVVPKARVVAQLQFGVGAGKGAAHEALRANVVQKPGQTIEPLAQAVFFVDPDRAAGQRHHACKRTWPAVCPNAHDGHGAPNVAHGAGQHITLLARRAHFLDLARQDERRERPRYRGLTHPKMGLQVCTAEHAPLGAQGLHDAGGQNNSISHESLYE